MNIQDVVEEAVSYLTGRPGVKEFAQIGSSLVVPNPQDVDFVVLVADDVPNLRFPFPGFEACSLKDYGDDTWCAVRCDDINLILTKDRGFYERSLMATKLVIRLNLTEKHDRLAVHQIVVDGQ